MRSKKLIDAYKKAAREKLKQVANEIERAMKAECPVETGELRASIHQETRGKDTIVIGARFSQAPQILYSDKGNKPKGGGMIVPKTFDEMYFMSPNVYDLPMTDGGYYHAKVIHPYEGTGWLEKIRKRYKAKYER